MFVSEFGKMAGITAASFTKDCNLESKWINYVIYCRCDIWNEAHIPFVHVAKCQNTHGKTLEYTWRIRGKTFIWAHSGKKLPDRHFFHAVGLAKWGQKREKKRKKGKVKEKEEEKRRKIVPIHYIANPKFVLYILPLFNMVNKQYLSPKICCCVYKA